MNDALFDIALRLGCLRWQGVRRRPPVRRTLCNKVLLIIFDGLTKEHSIACYLFCKQVVRLVIRYGLLLKALYLKQVSSSLQQAYGGRIFFRLPSPWLGPGIREFSHHSRGEWWENARLVRISSFFCIYPFALWRKEYQLQKRIFIQNKKSTISIPESWAGSTGCGRYSGVFPYFHTPCYTLGKDYTCFPRKELGEIFVVFVPERRKWKDRQGEGYTPLFL